MRRAAARGLPTGLEGEVWQALLGPAAVADPPQYAEAVAQAESFCEALEFDWSGELRAQRPQLCDDLDVVGNDVPRTFPPMQRQQGGDAFCAVELKQLLCAKVVAEQADARAVGYAQGMADIAAVLLQKLPPPAAFACLRCLTARPMLLLLFRLDPLEWDALGELHASLLRSQLPHVAAHLERLGMTPTMYLPEWLMPLWTRTLRPEVAALVWVLLITDGDALLLRAALAVLACISPQLLACDDITDARRLLATAPQAIELAALVGALEQCVVTEEDLIPLRDADAGVL